MLIRAQQPDRLRNRAMPSKRFPYDPSAFGRRLRQLRTARNLTQDDLVTAAGGLMTRSTISALELGKTGPKDETLAQLADALSLQVHELVDGLPSRDAARSIDAQNHFDWSVLGPFCRLGFITLEPHDVGLTTALTSAHGYHELIMSITIDGEPPHFESQFIIRPARGEAFDKKTYGNFVDLSLRVGSPKHFGAIRASMKIQIGQKRVILRTPLIPAHGWAVGETKQFFITTGPPANPAGFHSGPLTVKRIAVITE